MGESRREHPYFPQGQHRTGPRESARCGYRGTIVGEASHLGPVPPAVDPAGAPAPEEVLRYMRPTAQAGPGTPRSGGHSQSTGGKTKGTGRRGRSSVGSRAPGPVVPDAAPLSGGADAGTGNTPSHPGDATPLDRAADLPSAPAHAAADGAPGRGVAAGPAVVDGGLERILGERDESTNGADSFSGIMSDDGADAGERARAHDEPLLAGRQGDAPQPMDTGDGGALLGHTGGSEDESMPMVGLLID